LGHCTFCCCHDSYRRTALFAYQRSIFLDHGQGQAWALYQAGRPNPRRNCLVACISRDLWRACRHSCLGGWTQIYTDLNAYPLWFLPASLLLYLLTHDTWFYWTHRWMHQPQWFRIAHAVHHASKPPTAWTAMSFHPIEAATGAIVVPALVFMIPVHISVLGLVLTIMTIMGITNHMGWEMFPQRLVHSLFGQWLITASHHERHHEQYLCNFGLYFRIWDKLCGTDRGLSDKLSSHRAAGPST